MFGYSLSFREVLIVVPAVQLPGQRKLVFGWQYLSRQGQLPTGVEIRILYDY
jgi:hypothetical protein